MLDIVELTQRYFADLERGLTGEALAAYYDPEVIQEEFPNRLLPNGARRNLAEILAAAERGQSVMSALLFEILHLLTNGDRVAVEFRWTGMLAISLGSLAAGDEMRGRFASFLEFRNGRILSQRSYDCFEPW